jgi:hypothetical protein
MILFYQPLNPHIWCPVPVTQPDEAPAAKAGAAR